MLKTRMKRRTVEGAQAIVRLSEIEASITALKDDDLLDLADIFAGAMAGPLNALATAEMKKRNLSLDAAAAPVVAA